jgi:hypothetical protein
MNPFALTEPAVRSPKGIIKLAQIPREYARLFIFVSTGILLQSCAELQPVGPTLTSGNEPDTGGAARVTYGPHRLRVMMIGDSLTVGGFGQSMQAYLLRRFGSTQVAVYASCGSSPEDWIRSGPDFVTRCGYREQTPFSSVVYDYNHGRRPRPVLTPKLEDLIPKFPPKIVIVQLGTNWMDAMESPHAGDSARYADILGRFVAAIHSRPNTVPKIIWVTPPDSSRYPRWVQRKVQYLIAAAAGSYHFRTIDSSRLTHYIPGRSGGDGVHYNYAAANEWADKVIKELEPLLH